MNAAIDFSKFHARLHDSCTVQAIGKVTKVVGLVVEAHGPVCTLGSVCDIYSRGAGLTVRAEVLGFRDDKVLLMPLEGHPGDKPGQSGGGKGAGRLDTGRAPAAGANY